MQNEQLLKEILLICKQAQPSMSDFRTLYSRNYPYFVTYKQDFYPYFITNAIFSSQIQHYFAWFRQTGLGENTCD